MTMARAAPLVAALAACADSPSNVEWMAALPDERALTELSIPGTHDSGARFEPYPGIAKTQTLTIADQLAAGARYFDIRCRNFDDQFLIYHGPIDQNLTFDEVLATMVSFLAAHPHETVIMSVKEEVMSQGATLTFEQVFDGYVSGSPDRWYLQPSVPLLGDARGKLVLLRRFDATSTPLGIDAAPWADNTTFSIANGDASLRIEDYYDLPDTDTKWTAVTALLGEAGAGDPSTLYLTYTSGFLTINSLNNITAVSDDINARLDAWLADPANRHAHTGVVPMDFLTAARAGAIIATNTK
jgi:1-phosphatidylinositol phosphodiesterase